MAAAAYTLAQLRTLVLQRADMVNTTFIDNTAVSTELSNYIRDSARALHDKLLALSGDQFFWTTQTIAIVAGTDAYSLAADFYRMFRVELIDGDNAYPLDAWNPAERARDTANRSWTGEVRPQYLLVVGEMGDTTNMMIYFTPPPSAAGSVKVWYVYDAPDLAADADQTLGQFDEWIILDAAIKCRVKEESDVTALQAERGEVEKRMERWASQFDRYQPSFITDARAEEVW